MKRQTQAIGVRDWYGWDFLSLQEEPLKVVDGFFSQYGAFVLCGCEVTDNGSKFNVAPGLVVLEGQGAEGGIVKIVVPFAGITATTLPLYLTLGYETETDVYHDGKVKPIVNIYKAVATTVKPAGSHVEITYNGAPRFIDVIQDAGHRFINDAERKNWNNKADQADVAGAFKYDYIVDSAAKLSALTNNPNAHHVLIKSGTWTVNTQIGIHANCDTITGEPGSKIVVSNPSGAGTALSPVSALYLIERGNSTKLTNVTAEIKVLSTTTYFTVFNGFQDMERCTAINNPTLTFSGAGKGCGFYDCANLIGCKAQCRASWASGTSSKTICGFDTCENLTGCMTTVVGNSYSGNSSYMVSHGFDHCKRLTNCEATATNTLYQGHTMAFYYCDYLDNCKGTASGAGSGLGVRIAFDYCNYLMNCLGESSGNSTNIEETGAPYRSCQNVTQCRSIAKCTNAPGFGSCSYMSRCTSTKNFRNCYSGAANNSTYAAADTLNGGWNRILA